MADMQTAMTISDLVEAAHDFAKRKGFWDPSDPALVAYPTKLALIHCEVSEAMEEWRKDKTPEGLRTPYLGEKGKPEGFAVELADAFIRIADLAGHAGIDLEKIVEEKMRFNETRPHRHGGKNA